MILKVNLFSIGIVFFLTSIEGSKFLNSEDPEIEWMQYKEEHNKHYSPDEELKRKQMFFQSKKFIDEHNEKYRRGDVGFKLKINHLADKYEHEMLTMNMWRNTTVKSNKNQSEVLYSKNPRSFDWRSKKLVTPVKDQGGCGSCWAFSTVGTLESHNYISNKEPMIFSEQNLVDCSGKDTAYKNQGCQGGYLDEAFEYAKQVGIVLEKNYTYEESEYKCKHLENVQGVKIQNWKRISSESELESIIYNVGPVSVAIDNRDKAFTFYSEGIYEPLTCSNNILTHGLVVVGYDEDDNNDQYWILKNSWGVKWGNDGYMMLKRTGSNFCGIISDAVYPLGVELRTDVSSLAPPSRNFGMVIIIAFTTLLILKLFSN